PARLPEPGKQNLRIGRVEADIRRTSVRIPGQDLLPVLAAIRGAIDAALAIGPERMTEDCGERNIRVGRVDDQGADLAFLFPAMRPVLAGAGRFEDAVPSSPVAPDVGFPCTLVDDVRIGRGQRQRADGTDGWVVGNRLPASPAVDGLEDPTGRRG